MQAEVARDNSFSQFNAFESAAPAALKETPIYMPETQFDTTTSQGLARFEPSPNQAFEITDGDQVVASSCPGGCPCQEYAVRGWNRNTNSQGGGGYSDCDDGSCDDGSDYDPSGDCDDGGGCDDGSCDDGGGGGLLRGLLGRFGRLGMLGRMFGGGGFGFARGFRR